MAARKTRLRHSPSKYAARESVTNPTPKKVEINTDKRPR